MEEDVHRYTGKDIEVSYDSNRCIHVRECVEGLPGIFDPGRRPWVDADGATADEIAAVVERCPTGALQYDRLDGGEDEKMPGRNTVTVAADGPLYLHGNVRIRTSMDETLLTDTRIALCRCGHSENKPLCDNSHDRVFEAEGVEADETTVSDAASETGTLANETGSEGNGEDRSPGPLTVTLTKDGPFRLSGSFDLRHVDGEQNSESAALCRCGASEDKPFCDGTHAQVGFSTTENE